MTVTDEAKLFAIRQQLIQAQRGIDAATKIINYVFERDTTPLERDTTNNSSHNFGSNTFVEDKLECTE